MIISKPTYRMEPALYGDWKIIRTTYEYIDITCKDSHIYPDLLEQKYDQVVFIGPLQQCEILINKANE